MKPGVAVFWYLILVCSTTPFTRSVQASEKQTFAEVEQALSSVPRRDAEEWTTLGEFDSLPEVQDYAFSPDGNGIVVCNGNSGGSRVLAWQLAPVKKLCEFPVTSETDPRIAMSSDHSLILIGGNGVQVYATSTGEKLFENQGFKARVMFLQVTKDGTGFIGADAQGDVGRFPMQGGPGIVIPLDPKKRSLKTFAATPNGDKILVVRSDDRSFYLDIPAAGATPRPRELTEYFPHAHRVAMSDQTQLAVEGKYTVFLSPGFLGTFVITRQTSDLAEVFETGLTPDSNLSAIATNDGQILYRHPKGPSHSVIRQPPLFGPPTLRNGTARLGPDVRTIAMYRDQKLRILRLAEDPLIRPDRIHELLVTLLESQQFDILSTLGEQIFQGKSELLTEGELLDALLPSNDLTKAQVRMAHVKAWHDQDPADILPRILLAHEKDALAWKWRGKGLAQTVSEAGWKEFRSHAQVAASYLEGYKPRHNSPENYFRLKIRALMNLGASREDFDAAIVELLTLQPKNTEAHNAALTYLMPRWGGEPGDVAKYADKVAAQIAGEDGEAMYVTLASYQLSINFPEEYFAITGFDYDRIRNSLETHMNDDQLPLKKRENAAALLCRFARRQADLEVCRKAVAQVFILGWHARHKEDATVYYDVMKSVAWLEKSDGKHAVSRTILDSIPLPNPDLNSPSAGPPSGGRSSPGPVPVPGRPPKQMP